MESAWSQNFSLQISIGNIYRNCGLGGFERFREKAEAELNQFKNITSFCARRPREENQ